MVDKILERGISIIAAVPNCHQLEENDDRLFQQLLHIHTGAMQFFWGNEVSDV